MTNLIDLNVDGNEFSSTGGVALLDAIKEHKSLEEVILDRGRGVGDSFRDAIFYTCKLRKI
jgi:molybdenum-dependent DNA-binding transcriptional regulator ModE